MHIERVNSAYRLGFLIAFIFVLWRFAPIVGPHVRTYFEVVGANARRSHTASAAKPGKVSARFVEATLQPNFQLGSQLVCVPADRNWDYVCSYMLAPRRSRTTLQFGVTVDATSVLQISRAVPSGTEVPLPK
jgi:hypothetical protein